jgi:uncharacterized membrane protein YhaH (DUF805 family)
MSSTLEATLPAPAAAPTSARRSSGDVWIYLLIGALVFGAWLFTRRGYFKAGDDVGYWIGVAGAVMMLMLFSYPLRKYVRPLHRLGKVKWWFLAHMVLGIGGPLLILLHSTFRIGSLNAAVAMYSMLIVAGSGVVGRFIYLHVHRGLSGQKNNLDQLRSRAGLDESEARSRLHFAPQVEARLLAFSDHQLGAAAHVAGLLAMRGRTAPSAAQDGAAAPVERERSLAPKLSCAQAGAALSRQRRARGAVHRLRAPVRALARAAHPVRLHPRDQRRRARDRGPRLLSERLV